MDIIILDFINIIIRNFESIGIFTKSYFFHYHPNIHYFLTVNLICVYLTSFMLNIVKNSENHSARQGSKIK